MRSNINRSNKRVIRKRVSKLVPIFALAIVLTLFISITSVGAAETKEEQTYKYYTSVQIMPGDTLWSIASEYCYDCDMSVESYIREIKSINKLTSDSITSGQYLIVFYYSAN